MARGGSSRSRCKALPRGGSRSRRPVDRSVIHTGAILAGAMSLYEQAWAGGVRIAAFKLGHLFEYGVRSADAASSLLDADSPKAWSWYQKGADAGDPNALARFAERDERNAFAEPDPARSNAQLLQAFSHFAAAAERARGEGWPDGAWEYWRYAAQRSPDYWATRA